jgi:hypothetical protein
MVLESFRKRVFLDLSAAGAFLESGVGGVMVLVLGRSQSILDSGFAE